MNDLCFAIRQRLKNPGFTAVAVLTLALGIGANTSAYGHPGVGIVRDSRGNIFYTDLAQVWRLAPDGTKSIAVSNVHTHELCLDAVDNLYGEHLRGASDGSGKWLHSVWRRTRDGQVKTIVPATEGFQNDFGFARDAAGNAYWIDREMAGGPAIRRRTPAGAVTIVKQSGTWRDLRWIASAPNGTLYVLDNSDLVRVTSGGEARVLARRLSEDADADQRNKVFGLCADDAGNVWVAVHSLRVVKKIAPDGTPTIAARSPSPWAPSGVLATASGDLWLLECSPTNTVRVRHIAPSGQERQY